MNAHKKAVESFKTTTATTPNAIKSIAACALGSYAKAIIRAKHHAGMGEAGQSAVKGCDSIHSGASHTTDTAGNLPDSEVFSRPEFVSAGLSRLHDFGAGSAYPQGRQHGCIHVTIPSSTFWPSQLDGGFQSHTGARTMTKVNTPTTPANGITPALARQQAIENALESALYFIRTDHPHYSLCLATARARRALSLLKQACTEFSINGRA